MYIQHPDQSFATRFEFSSGPRLDKPVKVERFVRTKFDSELVVDFVGSVSEFFQRNEQEPVLVFGKVLALVGRVLNLQLLKRVPVLRDLFRKHLANLLLLAHLLFAVFDPGKVLLVLCKLRVSLPEGFGVLDNLVHRLSNFRRNGIVIGPAILFIGFDETREFPSAPARETLQKKKKGRLSGM